MSRDTVTIKNRLSGEVLASAKKSDGVSLFEGITMKAIWNGKVLAESDKTIVVEGNHYFPADAINEEFFTGSRTNTNCPWKGQTSYYNVVVDGQTNKDAAWYYPIPKDAAKQIKNYVAFWRGVRVES